MHLPDHTLSWPAVLLIVLDSGTCPIFRTPLVMPYMEHRRAGLHVTTRALVGRKAETRRLTTGVRGRTCQAGRRGSCQPGTGGGRAVGEERVGAVGTDPDGLWGSRRTCLWASLASPDPRGRPSTRCVCRGHRRHTCSLKAGSTLFPPDAKGHFPHETLRHLEQRARGPRFGSKPDEGRLSLLTPPGAL